MYLQLELFVTNQSLSTRMCYNPLPSPSQPIISICLDWSSRKKSFVPLISVHQKALVGNWCRIYGIIFKLEGVMEFSLCSYLDGRGHFKAHSSNSRRNGTERRDLGLLHVYVHWLTSMYPHNVFMVVEFSVWMPKITPSPWLILVFFLGKNNYANQILRWVSYSNNSIKRTLLMPVWQY